MMPTHQFPGYDISKTYLWNYDHAPDPVEVEVPVVPGEWLFCGLPVDSPLGVPAGPLLNGRWCLYYASLGFDVLTYKTVRSVHRDCYPLPNLQPVECGQLRGDEHDLLAIPSMQGSWAVSFGMPSKAPEVWRADVERTRSRLPKGKLLSVSVVGTQQPGWSIEQLAEDYAQCARWAVESGADVIEANFSCPNVTTRDGQLFQQPDDARLVAHCIRQTIGSLPFVIKIGHVASIQDAEALAEALTGHADALAMTNSVSARVRQTDGQPLFEGQPRGICGDAVRDASVQQTKMFSELIQRRGFDLQLIGVGGASQAQHVLDYLSAGASAVQIASAAMVHPDLAIQIKHDLQLPRPDAAVRGSPTAVHGLPTPHEL